jgi:hypothetical protein
MWCLILDCTHVITIFAEESKGSKYEEGLRGSFDDRPSGHKRSDERTETCMLADYESSFDFVTHMWFAWFVKYYMEYILWLHLLWNMYSEVEYYK